MYLSSSSFHRRMADSPCEFCWHAGWLVRLVLACICQVPASLTACSSTACMQNELGLAAAMCEPRQGSRHRLARAAEVRFPDLCSSWCFGWSSQEQVPELPPFQRLWGSKIIESSLYPSMNASTKSRRLRTRPLGSRDRVLA